MAIFIGANLFPGFGAATCRIAAEFANPRTRVRRAAMSQGEAAPASFVLAFPFRSACCEEGRDGEK
jgi:hypothetical protein